MNTIPKRVRERILIKKQRLDLYRPLPPSVVENIREELLIEYTHSSNALEGNTLTLGETRMVIEQGVTIGGKTVREHLEARNHPGAITFLEKLANTQPQITTADILRLHAIILEGINPDAGTYRNSGVRISGSTFTPPPSREVPGQMAAMLDWLNRNPDELSPMELASQLMHRLSQIHPFTDGNGRIGRLLMNLVLIKGGYPFITNISHRDRGKYLRALQESDEGNVKPLLALVARSVEAALDSYLYAIEEPKLIPLSKAAEKYGLSDDYLGLLARRGILPASKRGGRWMVSEDELRVYLDTVRRARRSRSDED